MMQTLLFPHCHRLLFAKCGFSLGFFFVWDSFAFQNQMRSSETPVSDWCISLLWFLPNVWERKFDSFLVSAAEGLLLFTSCTYLPMIYYILPLADRLSIFLIIELKFLSHLISWGKGDFQ